MSQFLDLHVLQTVPPSNVNRDETGSPKTAIYGGVRRARVSSQAWKRAMRRVFETTVDARDLGDRTRRVVDLLATEITAQAPELGERAAALAEDVLAALKIKVTAPKIRDGEDPRGKESGYLLFLARHQVRNLARLAVDSAASGAKIDSKEAKRLADSEHSIDVALFGRMVADVTDINVDACAQVAHALSVHAVDNEFDYFTAMDDLPLPDNAGAGMIGTVEFNSSTLYRYATLNLEALHAALGGDDEATRRAFTAFVDAFVTSMPTGKQNTFANRTLPDAVVVQLRDGQPVNLVGAYEDPVDTTSGGRLAEAARRLARHSDELGRAFSVIPSRTWVVAVGAARDPLATLGDAVDLTTLLDELRTVVPVASAHAPQPV